jgi:diadenosine tetraphosphatase ApaH/serine/threonine PP2A family protein phosphatase
VLAELDADGIELGVCLGDVCQGGPEPAECATLLAERGWPVVLGNADAFVLDSAQGEGPAEELSDRLLAVREWSFERLGDTGRRVVASYRPTVEVDLGSDATFFGCHATPASYDPVVFPTASEGEFRAAFGGTGADMVGCGHIHLPYLRRIGETLVMNPGSVGLGYDHERDEASMRFDPWASWAVVFTDGGRLSVEFRRTPFEAGAVVAAYRASGIPYGDESTGSWLPS